MRCSQARPAQEHENGSERPAGRAPPPSADGHRRHRDRLHGVLDRRAGRPGTQPQAHRVRGVDHRCARRAPGGRGGAVRPDRGAARRRPGGHLDRPGPGGTPVRGGRSRPGRPRRRAGRRPRSRWPSSCSVPSWPRQPARPQRTLLYESVNSAGRGQDARAGRPRPGRRRLGGTPPVAAVRRDHPGRRDHLFRCGLPAAPAGRSPAWRTCPGPCCCSSSPAPASSWAEDAP